ncbi:putative sodium, calcium exchanger protein isoform 2A [Teratosphaeria destructans]|uniref:Sodium, calcium exchanger protein isoform 2A n=1 Tax=Teratosphaeria destructans TaxID=418781 RepID=A0A9W7T115_9PEZI|nr:putative sodium, calcium exchanger protein isoform 2A [Teratosphaeria destructans]
MGRLSDVLTDRYRSQARLHAGPRTFSSSNLGTSTGGPILPIHRSQSEINNTNQAGGLSEKDVGRGVPSVAQGTKQHDGGNGGGGGGLGGRVGGGRTETSTRDVAQETKSEAEPPPAPPPDKSEDAGSGDSTLKSGDGGETADKKPKMTTRMAAGSKRFLRHTKNALLHSWVNVLLIFVPIGIAVDAVGLSPGIIFGMNAIAIIPLAGLLAHATECVAARLGDTLGALLNVSFGNAVELIIFIIALVKDEIRIVQASLLGSILANLLLILGMAFLFGGLRFREQIYNNTVTQMSACLLSLSVISLLLPTAFHASFSDAATAEADKSVLKISRGTSIILLLIYIIYLLFQLKSHAYMYVSTPQEIIDEESHPGVLAEMMNSSSSDDSSSSSSSDSGSDSSGSGSIITKGKRIRKKVFKNRKRRKSSASVSSTTASSSLMPSALSSPSTGERQNNYWEHQTKDGGRRESALGAIASGDEGDAENDEARHNIMPRIRDFVHNATNDNQTLTQDDESPQRRSKRKHHHKKHHKKRRQYAEDAEKDSKVPEPEQMTVANEKNSPTDNLDGQPKVGFADEIQTVPIQGQQMQSRSRLASNMRQFSAYRPGLPKVLSNTVFSTPPPQAEPRRLQQPVRAGTGSSGRGLRRTNSLPDLQKPSHFNGNATGPTNRNGTPYHQNPLINPLEPELSVDVNGNEDEQAPEMSRTAAVVLLLISTALVAVCAEFMVDAIPGMLDNSPGISQAFIGLIILPIVGNAAEHVTAVTVATKNKMDLAIGVAVGSSIQIALFVTPVVVLLGWILHTDMSLYFNLFETISLFATVFVVNFLVLDGRSNYLEGSLLIAAYVIIAVGAFFYPSSANQSAVGGAGTQ